MTWNLKHIEQLKLEGKIKGFTVQDKPKAKRSKYGNKKTDVNGIGFDSKKEAKRYKELKLLLKAGKIAFLSRQVEYELNVGGTHSLVYVADFVYVEDDGGLIVEDVKGFKTREYVRKKRLMKKIHGIEISEV